MPYDAEHAPDPSAWLAASEGERLIEVEEHHRGLAAHVRTPKPRLHAAIHLVVENQLATGDPPEVRRALARLAASGLSRHEAIHAIGFVVADAMSAAMAGRPFDPQVYARELDALTIERWRELASQE